jgi:hypothetical protein
MCYQLSYVTSLRFTVLNQPFLKIIKIFLAAALKILRNLQKVFKGTLIENFT